MGPMAMGGTDAAGEWVSAWVGEWVAPTLRAVRERPTHARTHARTHKVGWGTRGRQASRRLP